MSVDKKILLSGVKPTGQVHIGNYFGAMRQFVDLQDNYQAFVMLADYHALTTNQDPAQLRTDIMHLVASYLAIGLDPEKVVLFKQSDVPAHTELAWIFNCLTTMPYLMRAHAYKDAEAKNKEVSVGLFDYPLLMSADILLYSPDVVPVGLDQKQHLEIARDTAEKFNRVYGETFNLPEPVILENVKTVIGLDGQKMSKSYRNTIPLFASEKELRQLVMSIKTDSKTESEPKNPEECNVFALHKLFSEKDLADLKKRYVEGQIGYKESKEILATNMNSYLAPMREKYENLIQDSGKLVQILEDGAKKAREIADKKMQGVKRKVGVSF
ncbi:MAG: tryptophan--tRNA ligase [Patescibacteria group bacterium]